MSTPGFSCEVCAELGLGLYCCHLKSPEDYMNCVSATTNFVNGQDPAKYVNFAYTPVEESTHVDMPRETDDCDDTFISAAIAGNFNIIYTLMWRASRALRDRAVRLASKYGHKQIVRVLIPEYADKNEGMFGACEGNQPDILNCMLMLGADRINEAMEICGTYGSCECIAILGAHGAKKKDAFIAACRRGHTDAMLALFDASDYALINEGAKVACQSNKFAIIQQLLARGASRGYLLRTAAECGNEIVIMIYSYGCSRAVMDILLCIASTHNNISTAEMAITHGAKNINRAFLIACKHRYYKLAKALIAQGATNIVEGCALFPVKARSRFVIKHIRGRPTNRPVK